MECVLLVDGTGRRGPLIIEWQPGTLGPGVHVFVRHERSWFRRIADVRAEYLRVRFVREINQEICEALDEVWEESEANDSGDLPSLQLAIDALHSAMLAEVEVVPCVKRTECVVELPDMDEEPDPDALERLNRALERANFDLQFYSYLFHHADEVRLALQSIMSGNADGVEKLLLIVLDAFELAMVSEYDFESLLLRVIRHGASAAVRIEIELYEIARKLTELRSLVLDDAQQWRFNLGQEIALREPGDEPSSGIHMKF